MAITKRTEQDKIEVVGEFKHIQVRTATVIEEDGVELSRSFHRHVVAPDLRYHLRKVQMLKQWLHSFIQIQSRKHGKNIKRITFPSS